MIIQSNNKIVNDSIVLQCSCVCHCSYLEIQKFVKKDQNEYTLYAVASNKKTCKLIDDFNASIFMDNKQLKSFIKCLEDTIQDEKTYIFSDGRYYVKIDVIGDYIENSIYSLLFYKFKKHGRDKLVYDICLDYNQYIKLIKTLKEF